MVELPTRDNAPYLVSIASGLQQDVRIVTGICHLWYEATADVVESNEVRGRAERTQMPAHTKQRLTHS